MGTNQKTTAAHTPGRNHAGQRAVDDVKAGRVTDAYNHAKDAVTEARTKELAAIYADRMARAAKVTAAHTPTSTAMKFSVPASDWQRLRAARDTLAELVIRMRDAFSEELSETLLDEIRAALAQAKGEK